ncbi:hypothetical protein GGQ68_001218 [Sagittula marina]|uniref:Uncharacterized protein n=1 Tax=Sagittula marina TaxID=943940 RepID=A0A7W6GRN2_9RHOB|nr:hypothetical protein [Sagittula marina]MBB3984902.1 hypothetical protein [Sagittula marina]
MRAFATAAVISVGISTAAQAQWSYQEGPEAGRYAAYVCADGSGDPATERLCFGLSCDAGKPLRFGLRAEGNPDLLARSELDVQAFAGVRVMPPLAFQTTGLGTFEAPMTKSHLPGIEGLKAGTRLELRYWETVDVPPTVWQMSLSGSSDAISAVEAVCPQPDFAAQELAARTMADPAAAVLRDMRAACGALGGEVSVGNDYAQAIDLDGAAGEDLVLRHGALSCSTAQDLVCGPAGCLTSIWQANDDGFTRVFLNAVRDVAANAPGSVRLTLKGSLCGRVGAPECQQVWSLQDGELIPAP